MGAILYYISGRQGIGREQLCQYGLAHITDGPLVVQGVSRGPDGGPGVVCSGIEGAAVRYDEAAQSWQEIGGGAWVGWYQDGQPTPGELLRRNAVGGVPVGLGDGREWFMPRPEDWPRAMRYDTAAGVFVDGEVLPAHREIVGRIEAVTPEIVNAIAADVACEVEGGVELIADALAANYRVGRFEVGALGLLVSGQTDLALFVLCGVERIMDAVKKKQASQAGDTGLGATA